MNDLLEARQLKVLVTVLDEGSVSGAAHRLGVTQSAISHALDKLRTRFADPLFVREGRSITPTARALALEDQARGILDDLQELAAPPTFEPASARLRFTIAANDFQRDLLLPDLFRRVQAAVASLALDVMPSGMPSPDILTKGRADLLVTPHPPQGADIFQRQLLRDRQVCFYDAKFRAAPTSKKAYLDASHITLRFAAGEPAGLDWRLLQQGITRHIALTVSNFSAVPAFMRGSDLLATLPSLLQLDLLRDFAFCTAPVDTGRFAMYMVWHRRVHKDAAHQWFRDQLFAVANGLPALSRKSGQD